MQPPSLPSNQNCQRIFQVIGRAADRNELRASLLPLLRAHWGASRCAVFFQDEAPFEAAVTDRYQDNPLLAYLRERHAPVHEGVVLRPGEWTAMCPRRDHFHVMLGPILGVGQIVGAVALCRELGQAAFHGEDLTTLSAVSLHLSLWYEQQQRLAQQDCVLTPRERQIVELVQQGHTNRAIAQTLRISPETVKASLKRIFAKTHATSRAGLAARLR